jgi:hypothetical protein
MRRRLRRVCPRTEPVQRGRTVGSADRQGRFGGKVIAMTTHLISFTLGAIAPVTLVGWLLLQ